MSTASTPEAATGEVRVRNVSFSIGAFQILRNVSIECPAGEITGLLGPNGAGKTTLLNCISGLYQPTAGVITIGSQDLGDLPCHDVARAGVARTFQTPQIVEELTVIENVMLSAQARVRQQLFRDALSVFRRGAMERQLRDDAVRQMRRVGLDEHAERLAASCNHIERRLIEVARALCAEPRALLLDEPCAGMGIEERTLLANVITTLAREGITILLIEHDVSFVTGVSRHVAVLDRGIVIADGEPADVVKRPEVIDAYLGR